MHIRVILGEKTLYPNFSECFRQKLYMADTWLKRTICSGPVGVRFSQILLSLIGRKTSAKVLFVRNFSSHLAKILVISAD